MLPKFWQTRGKINIDNFAVVHVIISMARLRALPTLATGDFTHVISRTRLPIFSLVYVEKDREAWGQGYELDRIKGEGYYRVWWRIMDLTLCLTSYHVKLYANKT